MKRLVWLLAAVVATSACNGGSSERVPGEDAPAVGESDETPEVEAQEQEDAQEEPAEDADIGGARSIAEETDDFLFEYSYPEAAGLIPELAQELDSRLEHQRERLSRSAATARRQARDDGFPYNKHSYTEEWKVVANIPDWLSLSGEFSTYTGGAHGMYGLSSLVWNKEEQRALDGIELFVSPEALEEALGERFCKGLDRERQKRRDAPVDPESDDPFDMCPGVEELEVLVGSASRRKFDRLTLYAGPYVAGPYAEGAFEVNLAVDKAVLDAVRPEYRDSFAARN